MTTPSTVAVEEDPYQEVASPTQMDGPARPDQLPRRLLPPTEIDEPQPGWRLQPEPAPHTGQMECMDEPLLPPEPLEASEQMVQGALEPTADPAQSANGEAKEEKTFAEQVNAGMTEEEDEEIQEDLPIMVQWRRFNCMMAENLGTSRRRIEAAQGYAKRRRGGKPWRW